MKERASDEELLKGARESTRISPSQAQFELQGRSREWRRDPRSTACLVPTLLCA